jgi:hypothetical protein
MIKMPRDVDGVVDTDHDVDMPPAKKTGIGRLVKAGKGSPMRADELVVVLAPVRPGAGGNLSVSAEISSRAGFSRLAIPRRRCHPANYRLASTPIRR